MKSADGGGRSKPPIPERKPPVPERRPPIPAHKPPAPRPSAALENSGASDYSPPPRTESGGISPTTAAVVTALAMSAAQQQTSVGEWMRKPLVRWFLRVGGWALVVVSILNMILYGLTSDGGDEFWGSFAFTLFGLVLLAVTRGPSSATKTETVDKSLIDASPPPETGTDSHPARSSPSDWQPL